MSRMSDEEFWSYVDIKTPDKCWEWKLFLDDDGYGIVSRREETLAHRVAMSIMRRFRVPPNIRVCHTCDNPPCCNPAHLFYGDDQDNYNDSFAKGRSFGKLRRSKINDIRCLYENGICTQQELAQMFKVSQATISNTVTNKTWTRV